MAKLLLLGFLLQLAIFTLPIHAFHPYNLSDSSIFDSYETSLAATANPPLLVGLTLIHGADAKQAGLLFIFFITFIFYFFDVKY